jgi:2-amino-4-hydroxy-6-hydroxymethyldihydropteridine diphosphokinase
VASDAVTAYVALGSNLGDREAELRRALATLAATPGVRLEAVSCFHETEPVGGPPQGPYLNAAARVSTTLRPRALLARLHAIEASAGRARGPVRDLPRSLDLDLLFYGGEQCDAPDLALPHPRAHERPFVLEPLCELAPDLVHPRLGLRVAELRRRLRAARAAPAPGPG